jgi:hypothetical protein
LFKKLYNQSHKTIPRKQDQDQDDEQDQDPDQDQEHQDSMQYKNIYTLIEDKLKKIQECKKKTKSKPVKGRASKHASDLIEFDSDCLDLLDNYTDDNQDNAIADNLDQNTESLDSNSNIDNKQWL